MDTKRRTVVLVGSIAAAAALLLYYQTTRASRRRRNAVDSDIPKPQINFKLILADTSPWPFVHLPVQDHTESKELHPFHKEITRLLESLESPPTCLSTCEGPPPMTQDCIWIDTKEKLETLAVVLSKETEIAVDTEQHSIRSFLGFTSLIQISTGKQDFLIDAIALHDEIGILRGVFADPSIRKVFHGADGDNLWLQRDFHVYIVNLFDTAKACEVLGKRPRSLAHLLQNYCGVVTNKMFQRADWRLRPLPEEMIIYARTDAHYLLYIADCLQNELLKAGSMYQECLRRCNTMCLQLYEKDTLTPATVATSILSRYSSHSKPYKENACDKAKQVQRTLVSLCEWRDALARSTDESPRFILSDQAILRLAERVPRSTKAILSCACDTLEVAPPSHLALFMTPLPSPSPVLLRRLKSLKKVLDDTGCMLAHQHEKSQHRKDILAFFWKFQNSYRTNSTVKEVEEHENVQSSETQNSFAEPRSRRSWKSRDYEAARRNFVEKFSCKGPVYQNCRIYAGDGRLLCFCDRKKLDWYVQRGLAEFTEENPPAIRLLFEPKRRPEDENNEFYVQSKTNRCVGCGESSHYLRYRVIPSCYRQYFPKHLKSHRSHDIVLLCVDCHETAHRAAEKHKRQVALKFGVPLFAKRVVDSRGVGGIGFEAQVVDGSKGGVSPRELRSAAMALLRYDSVMPKERREELESVVQAFYGGRTITREDVEAALQVGKEPRELGRRHRKRRQAVDEQLLGPKKDVIKHGHISVGPTVSNSVGKESADINVTLRSGLGTIENEELLIKSLSLIDTGQTRSSSERFVSNHADAMIFPNNVETLPMSGVVDDERLLRNEMEVSVSAEDAWGRDFRSFDVDETAAEELDDEQDDSRSITAEDFENEQEPKNGVNGSEALGLTKETLQAVVSTGRKSKQRESLLGHGPHGKKVVEILLQTKGEDGIAEFCQVWRAVLVESVKPTYLPAGWDVLHSGRRDFGEYSIYNPSKRATTD